MRTSEELVSELHRRMDALRLARRRRQNLEISAVAGSVSLAAAIHMALWASRTSSGFPDAEHNAMTASIFADSASLSLVMVVFVAFCLGVFTTVFCFRIRKHNSQEDKHDDR